jgi:hypothetical protein
MNTVVPAGKSTPVTTPVNLSFDPESFRTSVTQSDIEVSSYLVCLSFIGPNAYFLGDLGVGPDALVCQKPIYVFQNFGEVVSGVIILTRHGDCGGLGDFLGLGLRLRLRRDWSGNKVLAERKLLVFAADALTTDVV